LVVKFPCINQTLGIKGSVQCLKAVWFVHE
jgi:hypothetical protein